MHHCPPQKADLDSGSSAYSSGPNGYYYSSSINSPHRASNSSQLGATSHPADYANAPSSAGPQPSPGFAPPQQSLGLPTLNQYHDGSQYRGSHEFPSQESRRSSLGSQVNTGFNNLHLNGTVSPYNSTNASQSSIAMSLQRERGIGSNPSGARSSRTSGSMHQAASPLSPFPGESRQAYTSRTAPIIKANPMKEVYNAEKPTTGQPYAFPDPEMSARSSASNEDPRSASTMISRRNSDHTSITSSVFTSDSRLPPGQHRLDDGKCTPTFRLETCLLTLCRDVWHAPSFTSAQASWEPRRGIGFTRCSIPIQPHACPSGQSQNGRAQASH